MEGMRRWAEFVLTHRSWVLLFWLAVVVVGGVASGQVSKRMTYDWSLPGEPGTKTAQQITQTFGNGGYTAPYLLSVTYPAGQTVAGHQAEVADAFDAVATKVPSVRVLDEANTGDAAFRTKDGRTSYAMVFYRFNPSPTAQIPTEQIRAALAAAKPAGSTVGVTGQDALAVGSDTEGPGVLAETLLGGVGALAVLAFVFASLLALLPLVVAAASIMATFALLLPLTYLGDFSAIVQFLIALIGLGVAIDYSLLLVTRWREERLGGHDNHDAVVAAMQTAGHTVLVSGVTVAIGLLALVALPVPFMRSIVIGVTGIGAAQTDFLHAVYGNFPLMLTLISLLTYVLLVRAFRSLLLPLKAVLLNLLSLGATYGLIVLFWQHGIGSEAVFGIAATGAITFWIPFMVFAFLFGLSMDYEVFILARIREDYDASGSTDGAVIQGMGRTGRLVTSAALILFLAFVALASGPITDLKVMATGLGFGILLDATIVRALLVPSLVSLFGSWNWYLPDGLARILRVQPSHAITPKPELELASVD